MKRFLLIVCIVSSLSVFSNQYKINKIEPAFWWTKMNNPNLQLMVYGKDIAETKPIVKFQGVEVKSYTSLDNPNYMFVDLAISPELEEANFRIDFVKDRKVQVSHTYKLFERVKNSKERKSFNSSDVIYLLMPDRFANGDKTNDSTCDTKEKLNREDKNGRHGGDIQGIINNLDYIQQLGATAIWSTPMLEDDCPTYSYHTYAISDYYKIDPRYGTNDLYKKYVNEAHKRGIKIIMDLVPNHCGSEHWWMKDLPSQDWIHQFPEMTYSNHQKKAALDPYASKYDKDLNFKGWFDKTMPDMNYKNPFQLKYFIQNSIWWAEFSGLDGFRVDTYPYNDYQAMAVWAKAVMDEYPNFNIVGECWQYESHEIAFWQANSVNSLGYNSHLETVMDFPLTEILTKAFTEKAGWGKGLKRIYNVLANDYLYPNPNNIMVFAENHDTQRLFKELNRNVDKFNLIMSFLMTSRGIPQIYYGSEIGMTGDKFKFGDGDIRRDFPGGWEGDSQNAFKQRTPKQAKSYDYLKKLLNWRKNKKVIHTGKMTHYVPNDNIYVYFRYNDSDKVMVVLNSNDEDKNLDMIRFEENLEGSSSAKDVISGKEFSNLNELKIKANSALILELK
jgi:glycosidase